MGSEVAQLVQSQRSHAGSAALYTIGLQGHRTLCTRWAPLPDEAELIEQIEERALRQANVLGGMHNFMVELYDATGQPLGSEVFRLAAENFGDTSRSLLTEPANEGGIVAMSMRHTEASNRTLVEFAHKVMTGIVKPLEAVTRRLSASEEHQLAMMQAVQTLVFQDRAQEAEIERAQGSAKAKAIMAERVAGLLPAVAAGIVSKLAPQGGAAQFAAAGAEAFFSSIRADQFTKLVEIFDPDQRMQLFAFMEGLAKQKQEQERAEAQKGQNGHAKA